MPLLETIHLELWSLELFCKWSSSCSRCPKLSQNTASFCCFLKKKIISFSEGDGSLVAAIKHRAWLDKLKKKKNNKKKPYSEKPHWPGNKMVHYLWARCSHWEKCEIFKLFICMNIFFSSLRPPNALWIYSITNKRNNNMLRRIKNRCFVQEDPFLSKH